MIRAHAPGRVTLIGDHTDHSGGAALPMAIDLGTTIIGHLAGFPLRLESDLEPGAVIVDRDAHRVRTDRVPAVRTHIDEAPASPDWSRHVVAMIEELRRDGIDWRAVDGRVSSTLPIGAGLSSSASLEIALALALGHPVPTDSGTDVADGSGREQAIALAERARRAESDATGVPCGLLDQLAIVCGRRGHAMVIDFDDLRLQHVPMPEELEIIVIHSGQSRTLEGSAYAERRRDCERAAAIIGPLARSDDASVAALADERLRRRARHVLRETRRVHDAALALRNDDPHTLGSLMIESHWSLRDDFEVSTPVLDELVERLIGTPGVLGARLTGAGFGGCVVAATRPGAIDDPCALTGRGWRVRAADGADVTTVDRH